MGRDWKKPPPLILPRYAGEEGSDETVFYMGNRIVLSVARLAPMTAPAATSLG